MIKNDEMIQEENNDIYEEIVQGYKAIDSKCEEVLKKVKTKVKKKISKNV